MKDIQGMEMIQTKHYTMFKGSWAALLVLLFSFQAGPAFSQGNLHIGRLKVTTGLTYKLAYNDNIFAERTNEEEDFIHTVTPAVQFDYAGTPGNFFSAGYKADLVAYSDFSDNNYQSHRPFVSLGIKTPVGFYFRAKDFFKQTADPYGTVNQYGIGSKTNRYDNTADFAVGYDFFERFGVEAIYRYYIIRYDLREDEWQDRSDHRYGATFFYKLSPKTSVFFQYRRTQAEYDEQNDGVLGWRSATSQDYTLNDYFLGARSEPGGKLNGQIKIGYGDKNFDNTIDKDDKRYQDLSSWIAETLLNWQARQRTRWTFKLSRSHQGSPDADAASYIDTIIGLGLNQGMANRLTLKLGFEYNKNDYQNEVAGRPDKYFDIYTHTAGLDWAINEWLTAGLSYKRLNKTASNAQYKTSEYDSNILAVFLRAVY
ncbi:outer membrane beta-barrel protein [Thermodesulfobacteriota bacterium]